MPTDILELINLAVESNVSGGGGGSDTANQLPLPHYETENRIVIASGTSNLLTMEQRRRLEGEVTLEAYVSKMREENPTNPPFIGNENLTALIVKHPPQIKETQNNIEKLSWVLSNIYKSTIKTKDYVRCDKSFNEAILKDLAGLIDSKIPNSNEGVLSKDLKPFNYELLKLMFTSHDLLEDNRSGSSHVSILEVAAEDRIYLYKPIDLQTHCGNVLTPLIGYNFSDTSTGLVSNKWSEISNVPLSRSQGAVGHITAHLDVISKSYYQSLPQNQPLAVRGTFSEYVRNRYIRILRPFDTSSSSSSTRYATSSLVERSNRRIPQGVTLEKCAYTGSLLVCVGGVTWLVINNLRG